MKYPLLNDEFGGRDSPETMVKSSVYYDWGLFCYPPTYNAKKFVLLLLTENRSDVSCL